MNIKSFKPVQLSMTAGIAKYKNVGLVFKKFQKIISNIGWLFAGKLLRMVLSMIAGIWVARYLGVNEFGILSFCMAIALLFRPMAMFQLEGICVREIVNSPGEKNEILGSAFIMSLVAGICSFLIAINLINILQPGEKLYTLLVTIIGSGLVFFSFEVFDYWFQAKVNSKVVVVSRTIVLILSACTKIIGIFLNVSVVFFAFVNLAEIVLTGIALMIVYNRFASRITALRVRLVWIKKLFLDAWPLALSGMAATIYLRIDKIMIGQMLDARDVGIYTAATRLAEAWYFLPICIMTSLYPTIIKAIKNKAINHDKKMQQIYNAMALLGYLSGILTVYFAKPIVTLLFGNEYDQSSEVLILYIWSGIFVNIAMGKAAYLKAMNYTKIQFISTLVGAAVNICLNLIFIRKYGVIGAAWATIISYSIEAYFILFLFPATRKQAVMITSALFKPIVKFKEILK